MKKKKKKATFFRSFSDDVCNVLSGDVLRNVIIYGPTVVRLMTVRLNGLGYVENPNMKGELRSTSKLVSCFIPYGHGA